MLVDKQRHDLTWSLKRKQDKSSTYPRRIPESRSSLAHSNCRNYHYPFLLLLFFNQHWTQIFSILWFVSTYFYTHINYLFISSQITSINIAQLIAKRSQLHWLHDRTCGVIALRWSYIWKSPISLWFALIIAKLHLLTRMHICGGV